MIMKVLITGAKGFIGSNLALRLNEQGEHLVLECDRDTSSDELISMVKQADFVVHLAGENRPKDLDLFDKNNRQFTAEICDLIVSSGRSTPIILASSTQAERDNPYGKSKLGAEMAVTNYCNQHNGSAHIFRLPNVFGKWGLPNYNSVVSTFCHNIARNLPIEIHDPTVILDLVYIDDVVDSFIAVINSEICSGIQQSEVEQVYHTTLGELAQLLRSFCQGRNTLMLESCHLKFAQVLYSVYISYLPAKSFSYSVEQKDDVRGRFVELLKTDSCGQVSCLYVNPGQTRGGHYHHYKTEKFYIAKGSARFRFYNLLTGEEAEQVVTDEKPKIVDTAPGWAHDITNIGDSELVVVLWANELFNPDRPDTIASEVAKK
jgi:UDP-2-acetamido-2,6-beta-L-arabino-hexul-4-ose reductase